MTRAVAVGSALLVVGLSGACAQIAALDEFGDVAAGGAGAGADSTGGGASSKLSCVPTPPSGWLGPVAFRFAEDPVLLDCDAGWPVQTALGGVGPPGGDVTCNPCACGLPTGASCPTTASAGLYLNASTCDMNRTLLTPTTTCTNHRLTNAHFKGFVPEPNGGTCAPVGGDVSSTPPVFSEYAVVCSPGGDAASCEGGVSVPGFAQPNDWATCIYQMASLSNCPAGSAYDEGPYLVASQYEDNRGCTGCECDPPAGAECGEYVTETYGQPDCENFSGFIVHDETCSIDSWTMRSYRLMAVPGVFDPGSCKSKQPSVAEGSVDVQEELSVCCIGAR